MATISQFVEKKLKLKVNQDMSKVGLSDKVKFLGFTVVVRLAWYSASRWKSSHCLVRRENVGEGKGVQRNSR
jgi:hypothetical protein